jgi:uncharacterized protein
MAIRNRTTGEVDTTIHVAQLLQEAVGATRQRHVAAVALPLDEELVARGVEADVKLTRIPAGVLAEGDADATVRMVCMRCLEEFEQLVHAEFADEYRPTVDVLSGVELSADGVDEAEAEYLPIDGAHILDLGESLRQAIVLALPMAPHCREDCPGLTGTTADDAGEGGEVGLAVLGRLLDDGAVDMAAENGRAETTDSAARRSSRRGRGTQ